jgi:hypothetical protein
VYLFSCKPYETVGIPSATINKKEEEYYSSLGINPTPLYVVDK